MPTKKPSPKRQPKRRTSPPSCSAVWMDAKTNPPKKRGVYIIHAPSADPKKPLIAMAYFNEDETWSLLPECWCRAITHWMPKPSPPNPRGQGLRSNTLDPVVGGPND